MIEIKKNNEPTIYINHDVVSKIVWEKSLSDINNVNKILREIKKQKQSKNLIYSLFFNTCRYSKNPKVFKKISSQIKNFDFNVKDAYYSTPLEIALKELNKTAILFLLENDADIDVPISNINKLQTKNLIIDFIEKQYLLFNQDTTIKNKNKIINELIEVLKIFVKNYYNLNIYEEYRDTTLLVEAVKFKNKKLVKYIIEKGGADIFLGRTKNITPILSCSRFGNYETFIYLIKLEKIVDLTLSKDADKRNILHYILLNTNVKEAYKMIQFLIKNKKDIFKEKIKEKDKRGVPPIFEILSWSDFTDEHKKLLYTLLKNNPELISNDFLTQLKLSIDDSYNELYEIKEKINKLKDDNSNKKLELMELEEYVNKRINTLLDIKYSLKEFCNAVISVGLTGNTMVGIPFCLKNKV